MITNIQAYNKYNKQIASLQSALDSQSALTRLSQISALKNASVVYADVEYPKLTINYICESCGSISGNIDCCDNPIVMVSNIETENVVEKTIIFNRKK